MKDQAQNMTNALRKPRHGALSVDQAIEDRINSLTEWLAENAPECAEQTHLDEGSPERAYWHHGYLIALRDLQALLRGQRSSLN
jgi:hypothetical protein